MSTRLHISPRGTISCDNSVIMAYVVIALSAETAGDPNTCNGSDLIQ